MKRSGSNLARNSFVILSLLGPCAPGAFADTFVVYGASGNVGTVIVQEALRRGHEVIGVSREPDSAPTGNANLSTARGDVTDPDSIVATVRGADAVIIAVGGGGPGNTPEEAVAFRAAQAYIEAAAQLGAAIPHVIQVGSGTSLNNADGVRVLDTLDIQPGTPQYALFQGHWLALEAYRNASFDNWTVMSAAYGSIMQRGEQTGCYRLGGDETLLDRNGSSLLSKEDYAIAVIDMAESHTVTGKRVAVGPMW